MSRRHLLKRRRSGPSTPTLIEAQGYAYVDTAADPQVWTLPTGPFTSGQYLEFWVHTQENGSTNIPGVPTLSGWTQIVTTSGFGSFQPQMTGWYKFSDGTEGGTTVSVDWTPTAGTVRAKGGFARWDGVHATTPLDGVTPVWDDLGTGDPNPPSLTTITDDAVVVTWGFGNAIDAATNPAPPTGYTEGFDDFTPGTLTGNDSRGNAMGYKSIPTAGVEDAGAWDISITSGNSGCASYVLRPAAS